MRSSTMLRLALLGLLAQMVVACGGGASQVVKDDAQSWDQPAKADDDSAEKKKELTDADFQVRNIEEVKAPRYLLGIEQEAQDLFRQGIVLVLAVPPRYKLGETKFRAAIDKDPKFMEAYFNLGMTLERQGLADKALEIYNNALAASPDDVSAQAYIAKIYMGRASRAALLGDKSDYDSWLSKTKTLLDELAPKEPENVTVNNALALYWLLQGDVETASQKVKEVLYVEPRNVTGLNTRGLINLKEKKYLIAEWIFKNKVLSEDPNSTEALTNLGYTYIQLDQRPLAMRYFKKALAQDAENMEVRMNIAAMLLEHLNYSESQIHYATVYKAQPLNMEALEGLCDATYGMGGLASDGKAQFAKGIDCYLTLIQKRPEKAGIYKRIAETYQHKFGGDVPELTKAVKYYTAYAANADIDEAEKKKTVKVVAQLTDWISKGGLKAILERQRVEQEKMMEAMENESLDSDDEEGDDTGDESDGDDAESDGGAEESAGDDAESDGGAEEAPADGESVPQA
jgi:tetratricopeptide (TPR) repeat protein